MKKFILILGISSTIVAGVVIYHIRKAKQERRLVTISDAGYETAYDVLYPMKTRKLKKRLLLY